MSTPLKRWPIGSWRVPSWRDWLPLLIILVVGAALRLYRVGELPPGLYRDEAFYGLDALNVLHGHPAVFFAANNGREGLFIYLLAGGIALLGRTPETLRLVSAVVGTLTLLALYAAARNLFSHRVGVLSAAILCITFWHLALSRIAYRAITLPLLLCLTVALGAGLLRLLGNESASRRRIAAQALAAGVALGLTLYTYTSAQFVLLLLALIGLVSLVGRLLGASDMTLPSNPHTRWVLLLYAAGALGVLLPFLIWLTRHPDLYLARAGQVSILSPIINKGDLLGTLLGNVLKAAGMFVWQGDRIWRHNLSLRPVFDGGIATAFVIGVLVCAWRAVRRSLKPSPRAGGRLAYAFVLLWLLVFLIPTILAEDTPHFLRAIGALPAACLVAALGLEAGLAWLSRHGFLNLYPVPLRRLLSPPALVASAVLLLAANGTLYDYFEIYAHKDMTAYWLEDNNVQLAATVNAYVRDQPPATLWLQDRLANDNPALRFLSPAVEQGQVTLVGDTLPGPVSPATTTLLIVDPNHVWTPLLSALPARRLLSISVGPQAQGDLDVAPHVAFIAARASASALPVSSGVITLEQGIVLQGATLLTPDMNSPMSASRFPAVSEVRAPNNTLTVPAVYTLTLYWSTTQPIPEDFAVFVHWQRGNDVVAQHDGSPAEGYLPMPTWRSGDAIADTHNLRVPGGALPGDEVQVGVYRRAGNQRLRVRGAAGALDQQSAPQGADVIALYHFTASTP